MNVPPESSVVLEQIMILNLRFILFFMLLERIEFQFTRRNPRTLRIKHGDIVRTEDYNSIRNKMCLLTFFLVSITEILFV